MAGFPGSANGNMTARGSQTLAWDVENRVTSVTQGGSTSTFSYAGEGQRLKKVEGGETVVYPNQYYEKNLTTGTETLYYYLGGKLIALKKASTLTYLHREHLGSSFAASDGAGSKTADASYYPYGGTRGSTGSLNTDHKFTGQRLDGTGLYYYGARYYDPEIGRFLSADPAGQIISNPQKLNGYAYALNNPLRFVDPTGHFADEQLLDWGWTQGQLDFVKTQQLGLYQTIQNSWLGDRVITDQGVGTFTLNNGQLFIQYSDSGTITRDPVTGEATVADPGRQAYSVSILNRSFVGVQSYNFGTGNWGGSVTDVRGVGPGTPVSGMDYVRPGPAWDFTISRENPMIRHYYPIKLTDVALGTAAVLEALSAGDVHTLLTIENITALAGASTGMIVAPEVAAFVAIGATATLLFGPTALEAIAPTLPSVTVWWDRQMYR